MLPNLQSAVAIIGTYIDTIFKCTETDEVLCQLEVFRQDFVESGLASQIPSELCPTRIRSHLELNAWLMLVRIAVEQHTNGSNLRHDTLIFLGTILGAASRRIELFDSDDHELLHEPARVS
jgi:hypothetical protein